MNETVAARAKRALTESARRAVVAANRRAGFALTRIPDGSNAVLMYHSVGNPAFSANVAVEKLCADLELLERLSTVRVVDLPAATEFSPTERRVAITFDDGFENFYTEVLPLVREYDVPVTVFLNPAFVGDNRRAAVEEAHQIETDERIVVSESEVAALADEPNVTLGNHTTSHCRLDEADDETLETEIREGKRALETTYGVDVDRFCYPYGGYDHRAVDVVRESHELAVTTRPFVVTPDDSRYELPRLPANLPTPDLSWEATRLSDLLPLRDPRLADLYPE